MGESRAHLGAVVPLPAQVGPGPLPFCSSLAGIEGSFTA